MHCIRACMTRTYDDLGGGAGQVVAAEAEVYELAERDDDGRLEDDEEQRVQRHVLDRAVGGAIDGSRHAAGPIAGRSQACRMPTPAASRAGRDGAEREG